MNTLGFYIFYIIAWFIALLPFKILYLLSDILFAIVYYIIPYRKKVVLNNLHNSFPGKSRDEIDSIAKAFYTHFCDIIFEVIKMIHLSKKQLDKRVVYEGLELFTDACQQNKHITVFLGHNGNWEWISGLGRHICHHAYTVYKPLNNKHFDRFMYRIRTRMGIDLLPIRQVSKELLKNARNNHLTATGFIADQTPTWDEIGYWTEFLNQDTPFSIGVEKITKKMNAAVVYLATEKVSRGYYKVNVIKLFDESKDQPEYAITEKYARVLEEHIQKHPAHWLWSHRRWKRKRKRDKRIIPE